MKNTFQLQIIIESYVNPSESHLKVIKSIQNVSPDFSLEFEHKIRVIGYSNTIESIMPIFEQIKSRSIFATLKRLLLKNLNSDGNSTFFLLNKQAAFVGVVSLVDDENESSLGPIKITIKANELEDFIENNLENIIYSSKFV